MKFFNNVALPTDLATTMTTVIAGSMAGYGALRDATADISQRTVSWYERSEAVDHLRHFGASSFLTVLGPAICVDMLVRPSKHGGAARFQVMPLLLKGSLAIGVEGIATSVINGARLLVR